jgi:hypothetical protein
MTIQKLIITVAFITTASTTAIFAMQSHETPCQQLIKALQKKNQAIFTVDQKIDGTLDPETPLYINCSEQKIQSTDFLQDPAFQNLVIHSYTHLTGKAVKTVAEIRVELNLTRNPIAHLAPNSFKGYTISVLTLDEKNMWDDAVNELTSNNDSMILWE